MRYLYLLRAGESNFKIGIATSVKKRVSSIQTGCPDVVRVVCARLVQDAAQAERSLHLQYADKLSGGGTEWFKLTSDEALEVATAIHALPERELVEFDIAAANILSETISLKHAVVAKLDYVVRELRPELTVPLEADPATKSKQNELSLDTQALDIFKATGRASTSLLQRRLGIGYAKAARIMDRLAEAGYVSSESGANGRVILEAGTPSVPESFDPVSV